MSESNGKSKPKYISIIAVVTPIIVVLLGFVLVYRHEAKLTQIKTKMAELELASKKYKDQLEMKKDEVEIAGSQKIIALNEIRKKILELDLDFKKYRDRINIEGQVIKNHLDNLEAEVKRIRDRLDITSKQLNISSTGIQLVNDITPKILLSYMEGKTLFNQNNKKVTVVFNVENQGKYGCTVNEPITSLSKGRVTEAGELKGPKDLVAGKDYLLGIERKYGYFPAGTKHPLRFEISLTEWPSGEKLGFKVVLNYQTDESVVNVARDHLRDFIPEDKLSQIIKSTFTYNLILGF